MGKRAFLVLGPESSGNRMMAGILARSGCIADPRDDGLGLWANIEPEHEPLVAIIFSYPNGTNWPDIKNITWRLRNKGYLVWALVMNRDIQCVQKSQEVTRLKPAEIMMGNYQRAYRTIFQDIDALDLPYLVISYEAIVRRPVKYVEYILKMLNLDCSNLGGPIIVNDKSRELRDENEKYY